MDIFDDDNGQKEVEEEDVDINRGKILRLSLLDSFIPDFLPLTLLSPFIQA